MTRQVPKAGMPHVRIPSSEPARPLWKTARRKGPLRISSKTGPGGCQSLRESGVRPCLDWVLA